MKTLVAALLLVVLMASPAPAQLLAAKEGPIVYGHHHLNATSVPATMKFFADTLGGVAMKVGTTNLDIVKFPNVLLFMRPNMPPSGGTKGSTVPQIGFSVSNLPAVLGKVRANGFAIVTKEEMGGAPAIKDDIFPVAGGGVSGIAFVKAPDEVIVELVEMKAQAQPIMLHHLLFAGQQNKEMQAWYAKVFGAKVNDAGVFPSAELPGVLLSFMPSKEKTAPTQGRALDHIGFEVRNLKAFVDKLEADGIKPTVTYREIPTLKGVFIAWIVDPWGTSIELSEGLNAIQ